MDCEEEDDIDDLHICGACKRTFADIDLFVLHKRNECIRRKGRNISPSAADSQPPPAPSLIPTSLPDTPRISEAMTADPLSFLHPSDLKSLAPSTEPDNDNESQNTTRATDECGDEATHHIAPEVEVIPTDDRHPGSVRNEEQEREVNEAPIDGHFKLIQARDGAQESRVVIEMVCDSDQNNEQQPNQEPNARIQTLRTNCNTDVSYELIHTKTGKRFFCRFSNWCEFSSCYLKDVERHYRTHTGEKPFKCKLCEQSFNRSDKLRLHERIHTGEKPYPCKICPYASSDRSSLVKHMRIHNNERPYKCQMCPYASRNSSQLVVHLRTHTGDAPFRCPTCSSSFKINSDLKRHMRLHTGEKPFACEICSYRCSIKGNLRIHMKQLHSAENLAACEVEGCEYSTSSKKAMREHMREHTEGKPLKCDKCSYTTKFNSALLNHNRIHTNERPYTCEICGYSCRQSCNLRTHIRKKHPDKEIKYVRKRRKADTDEDEGEKEQVVEKNKKAKHRPSLLCQKSFSCQFCDCSFVREDSLRCHLRHHREVLPQAGAALAILELQHSQVAPDSQTLPEARAPLVIHPAPDTLEEHEDYDMVLTSNLSSESIANNEVDQSQEHVISSSGENSQLAPGESLSDQVILSGCSEGGGEMVYHFAPEASIIQSEMRFVINQMPNSDDHNIQTVLVVSDSNANVVSNNGNIYTFVMNNDQQTVSCPDL